MPEISCRKRSPRFPRNLLRWTLGLLITLAPLPAAGQAKPAEPDLSAIRSALKKYEDPYVAIRAPPDTFPISPAGWESIS
jgi:hypothetical protein